MYNKNENSVTIEDSCISSSCSQTEERRRESEQPEHAATPTLSLTRSRSALGQRRKLTATLSTTSTSSLRSPAPEFTDISIGADLIRFQVSTSTNKLTDLVIPCQIYIDKKREHQNTLHQRCSPFRRSDTISLNAAIRNSLAMLLTYCTCSLPLVIMSVPGTASSGSLAALQRVQVLMLCRILFSLNAPAYPLWYLCCSGTVRKCFSRLWETFVGKHSTAGIQ
ncbi:hypothetical protein PoB_003629900 [Plakobranchus ocellatus]|uniref:G-protein coupled receptors family 1 profile domain-containing protein n=1 Tax=Plakobranchus ocellatus TaxID=259542 RepID=A0AAV4AUM3_9GAST|nr:hypothetical protein PoB_003629900 [Plakobranchus ocellatus]